MAVETVAALVAAGNEVTVIVPDHGPLGREFHSAGAAVLDRPVPVLRKRDAHPLRLMKLMVASIYGLASILRILGRSRPELVYVNTIIQPLWLIGAWLFRIQSVVHVREVEASISRPLQKGLTAPLRLASAIVCNSEATRSFVVRNHSRLSQRSVVIYNGKDWEPYYKYSPRAIVGEVSLLAVGRLSPRKGQDVLLEAVLHLVRQGVDVKLDLVGDVFPGYEWFRDELAEFVRTNGLSDRVHFSGFRSDVAVSLAEADIVVVPSRMEPFGTVAAEAMAAMRPVVVTDVEGLREIVEHMHTGIRVRPENPSELAEAIRLIASDEELWRKLTLAGYEYVRDNFSKTRYQQQIANVCETVSRPLKGGARGE
ncbi:glycosyltransferase family 4 protein [Georgenia sp. EYE_87]|nr:glycosyltransferase family 4 protein [Georgenia sp. EYE_87]